MNRPDDHVWNAAGDGQYLHRCLKCQWRLYIHVLRLTKQDELYGRVLSQLREANRHDLVWMLRGEQDVVVKHFPRDHVLDTAEIFVQTNDDWATRLAAKGSKGITTALPPTPSSAAPSRPADSTVPISPASTMMSSSRATSPRAFRSQEVSLESAVAAGFQIRGRATREIRSPSPDLSESVPPPWKETRAAPPAQSSGGSLLEQLTGVSRSSGTLDIPSPTSRNQVSASGPHLLGPEGRSLASRMGSRQMVIRVTEDESVGGSPPESDEDQPSVSLPHSAERRVQRPPKMALGLPSRSIASTINSHLAGSRARAPSLSSVTSASDQARSASGSKAKGLKPGNANLTPLGSRR